MKLPTTHPNHARDARLKLRLEHIARRLANIADIEAKAALVGGYGSNGEFDPERQRLIDESDDLLDELQAIGGTFPLKISA